MELRIGFSKSIKDFRPMSRAIIWWDMIRYNSNLGISHCYGKFVKSSWQRDLIYQASGHSTNFMGGVAWSKLNQTIEEYALNISDEAITKIGQTCIDREGKKYGVMQNLGIAISGMVWIATLGKITIDNPFSGGDDETNCIEEWARILSEDLEVELPEKIDGMSVRPFRDWIAGLPMTRLIS